MKRAQGFGFWPTRTIKAAKFKSGWFRNPRAEANLSLELSNWDSRPTTKVDVERVNWKGTLYGSRFGKPKRGSRGGLTLDDLSKLGGKQ